MPWPNVTDFTGAIQSPSLCFEDQELKKGKPTYHPARGTPLVYSGNFASVYPVTNTNRNRKFAVRCFTRELRDQETRYRCLNDYLRSILPPYLVEFDFHRQGIRVKGEWYPIVKMDWVNGMPLNKYVDENLRSQSELWRVARRWRGIVSDLQTRGIAHNDLQHGNVMVQDDGDIKLVDYDGIFLPEYQGQSSPETGHQNFQHPLRSENHYDQYVDNFPAIVVYLSLLALAADPGLWQSFYNDDNLIFKKSDYADPANSQCFQALKNNPDKTVQYLVAYLEECCTLPVDQVPNLESILRGDTVTPASAAMPVSNPPPPAPDAHPGPGTGSQYRDLIQSRQMTPAAPVIVPVPPPVAPSAPATPIIVPAPPVAPPPQPPAPASVVCPQCNRDNSQELIYCDNEGCATVLHQGSQTCSACGRQIPVNARYCPDCGRQLA